MRLQRTRFQPRESGVVLMTHLARVLLLPLLAWGRVCRMVERGNAITGGIVDIEKSENEDRS